MALDPTDPRGMQLAAGSSGGKYGFMNMYMESFQKTTREQWKNAAAYQEEFKETSWTEARSMLQTLIGFVSKLSILGEFVGPFSDLLEVFDAEIIKEFKDEIVSLNKALQELYPAVRGVVGVIRTLADWMKALRDANDSEWSDDGNEHDPGATIPGGKTIGDYMVEYGGDITDPNSGWYKGAWGNDDPDDDPKPILDREKIWEDLTGG